jgi:hypothetical protein
MESMQAKFDQIPKAKLSVKFFQEFWFDIVATMLFAISAAFIAWFVIENQLYQRTFLLISGVIQVVGCYMHVLSITFRDWQF